MDSDPGREASVIAAGGSADGIGAPPAVSTVTMHDCSEAIDMIATNARPMQNDATSHAPLATRNQSGSFAGAATTGGAGAGVGAWKVPAGNRGPAAGRDGTGGATAVGHCRTGAAGRGRSKSIRTVSNGIGSTA